jgi:HlyD family secretion protein
MNRQRVLVGGLLAAAAVIVAGLVVLPHFGQARALTGYVEGEPLYLAAPIAGTVKAVYVARGDVVKAGARLFEVDPQQASDAVRQAQAQLAEAQAQALDARKGQRPSEIAALNASLAAAEAQARAAETTYRRTTELAQAGVASRQQLDDASANARALAQQALAARRRRDTATLGARPDQVRAAEARVGQAQAALAAARARLGDLGPKAPADARVEDVFFQPGEWAAANQPILALLPDAKIHVRFFVPERALSAYRPGGRVRFACDGCPAGLSATITYVSPRPEFTPPVIYSRDSRDRLVYLVEARPSVRLNPGQPVDVVPLEPAR